MYHSSTAIIIGAGIGGLATVVQLAHHGVQVTIYEKNREPGGRCHRIVKDGHTFDTGPTMFLFPQLYRDFFSSIDEDITQHLNILPTDPTYRLFFPDHTTLTLTADLKKMRAQLEAIEPGSFHRYLAYLKAGKRHYDLAIQGIATQPLAKPSDYFNPMTLFRLLQQNAILPHYFYTSRFFKHPNLRAAFTFQDSYLSLHPFQTQAIYSLFTYSEITEGSFLPQGGMYQVILALEKIAKRSKVKIIYNAPVKTIEVNQNRTTGVILKDGTVHTADCVIANADLSYVYQQLLPPEPYVQTLLKKPYSCSALAFHWGLKKTYPQLQAHNLFFADDYRAGFDQVINHWQPPAQPHFYIQAPTRIDPTRAPKGQDTLTVMIPINHLDPKHSVDWQRYKNRVRRYVLDRLKQMGLMDIEENLKFEASTVPTDWQQRLNLPYGAIYGLHHNLLQVGYLRPSRQHKKYKNLFFVGASTHPGSGLPTVLQSARFTAERVLEELY